MGPPPRGEEKTELQDSVRLEGMRLDALRHLGANRFPLGVKRRELLKNSRNGRGWSEELPCSLGPGFLSTAPQH